MQESGHTYTRNGSMYMCQSHLTVKAQRMNMRCCCVVVALKALHLFSFSPTTTMESRKQSRRDVLLGFLAVHALMAPVVLVILSLLAGLYYWPHTVLLAVIVPYYTYALVIDRRFMSTGAPWDFFRTNFVLFPYARRLLNLRLVGNSALEQMEQSPTETSASSKTTTSNPSEAKAKSCSSKTPPQYILGVFPHGLNADFRVLADGLLPEILPQSGHKVRSLAATVLFAIPIVREVALWTGCVDASKDVARRNLRNGLSLLIMPGGQQEQLRTTHGKELVYLQRRKGFVKLAIEFGVPLVPVYVFGANDMYQTSHFALSTRLTLLKYLGISWTLGRGLCGSPYCPLPVDITMVFGEPIMVQQMEKPSPEVVEDAHAQFVAALQQLFDKHKASLGYGDRTLEIM